MQGFMGYIAGASLVWWVIEPGLCKVYIYIKTRGLRELKNLGVAGFL